MNAAATEGREATWMVCAARARWSVTSSVGFRRAPVARSTLAVGGSTARSAADCAMGRAPETEEWDCEGEVLRTQNMM